MINKITSINNEVVKSTVKLQQKKYRDIEKKFLLEGFKPIEEAVKDGINIEYIFVQKDKSNKYNFEKEKLILTNEQVLKKISTTDSAPEAVAVAIQKRFSLNDINSAKKILLLEGIKDLGNLGTILRTAEAFSQDAIILYGETAELYNPKCVRSAVGNLWKIPVVEVKNVKDLEKFENYEKIATLPKSIDTVNAKDLTASKPYILMFGSEADGLSDELINLSTKKVTIEMNSKVESLNLSMSVGILLYQLQK